jgi:hypothetical protein
LLCLPWVPCPNYHTCSPCPHSLQGSQSCSSEGHIPLSQGHMPWVHQKVMSTLHRLGLMGSFARF